MNAAALELVVDTRSISFASSWSSPKRTGTFVTLPVSPENRKTKMETIDESEVLDVLIWATGIAPREENPMVEKACQLVAAILRKRGTRPVPPAES